jgi:hypothetical protein
MAAAAGDPIRREEERLLVAIKSKRFDELIAEAERQPFAGWDFSYVKDQMVEAPLP